MDAFNDVALDGGIGALTDGCSDEWHDPSTAECVM
jgi:hypothetical protein